MQNEINSQEITLSNILVVETLNGRRITAPVKIDTPVSQLNAQGGLFKCSVEEFRQQSRSFGANIETLYSFAC